MEIEVCQVKMGTKNEAYEMKRCIRAGIGGKEWKKNP